MRNAMRVFPYGGIEYGCGIDFAIFDQRLDICVKWYKIGP